MSDTSVQQQSGLGEVRELERDLTLNETAELEGCHANTIRYRIKDGQYESYLDGAIRKVTRRSALARRNRLLQNQPVSGHYKSDGGLAGHVLRRAGPELLVLVRAAFQARLQLPTARPCRDFPEISAKGLALIASGNDGMCEGKLS
jgi:hypothetical protein